MAFSPPEIARLIESGLMDALLDRTGPLGDRMAAIRSRLDTLAPADEDTGVKMAYEIGRLQGQLALLEGLRSECRRYAEKHRPRGGDE